MGLGSALLISGLAIVPATQAQTPIGELQESQGITISGTVISVVGNDFILDDGTGNIIVDAGPRWWHEINIEPGEELTVVGKLDNDEFDAISITKADGTVIQIRPASGPPPWAEGRDRR
ncbi:MAG: NirD/YgiW/YdeI family stress tolerance protein [Cyanobacteria bacterium CRU_2_1]|nr:NirD/YgiW/YdeI family stress tolerance protein [Cyanobacteria bacterium RU_5_0]NJR57421.1 NirD/YgiW/YdeI family stress tolerance protein [Cyanobacteria bacterium CRU_2_1]